MISEIKSEHLVFPLHEQLLVIDALKYYIENNKENLSTQEIDDMYFLLGDLEHNNGIVQDTE